MPDAKVAGTIPAEQAAATPQKDKSDKPNRPLPTDRISFTKQLEILRGYAALVGQGVAAPTNPAMAHIVKLHDATSILAHPFFLSVGLLAKTGQGYVPAPEVLSYGKAFSWNPDAAGQKLAPVLRKAWFADVLLPRLQLAPMDDKTAIEELAVACSAGPKYVGQLRMVLQYLSLASIVRRDGDTLRAVDFGRESERMPTTTGGDNGQAGGKDTALQPGKESGRIPAIATSFAQVPEGVLRFSVDVNVDMRAFASWRPDRIAAFWAGIAQVLAAKADVEGESSH